MKSEMKSPTGSFRVVRNSIERSKPSSSIVSVLAFAAACLLAAMPARAANLLVNPGFEQNSGHNIPIGWTRFAPASAQPFGNYWIESRLAAHSGTYYWKQWGASYLPAPTNNVAGIYQTFNSAPGSTYQASGWFYTSSSDLLGADCYTWIEVAFLDSSSNMIALYKSANFSAASGADAWIDYPVTNACDLSQPVSTGDPFFTTYAVTGSVSQLVAPVGTAMVRYQYAYLQAGTEGGSAYLDDAVLDQVSGPIPPVISDLFPQNMIFVNPSDGISFNVSSPSGFTIESNGIQLVLNGTNVSPDLVITGSSSNKNVTYSGLQSNSTYTVSITAKDAFDLTASANTYFETTWVGVRPITYLWEAEDWDYSNGMYLDDPQLCTNSGNPNCYFGKVGVEGVDEHNMTGSGSTYRPGDPMGLEPSGDYFRPNLFLAGRTDYAINPFAAFGGDAEWVNYTRDWSNSTNWMMARLATDIGLSGSLTLSKVNPDMSTTDLGTFTVDHGQGWTAFQNIYLKDTNGNIVNVILNGKETLRVTSGGNLLPNFFMLVAAEVDLPRISGLYPTGTHPFEYTNQLSFTVTTLGATFPGDGIKVSLDGNDVSSNLVITGSDSAKTVVYPTLQPNAIHTALIMVTNSLGHGISVTNHFDTFSQDNYMFEAEDYDYGGGQFVPADLWYPDAYAQYTSVTNIDFEHTYIPGEPTDGSEYTYRVNGIPAETAGDYLRQVFIDYGGIDYHLYWFGPSDWANYTREYPAGAFYIYARSSGLGPFTMDLDQVASGAGTTNQVTSHLGQWSADGINISTHTWVPLTDAGQVAPVAVKLGGISTLRVTTPTGNCYPNYFMLVPVSGLTLSATRSGNTVNISFPTEAGANYRVFYRTNLAAGNWTLLEEVLGDGSVKSATDSSAAGSQRFYRVTSP